MEEIILVAGTNKIEVCWLRHCLRENSYNSIPCKSAEQIIEEIEIIPTCDATVPFVIIELEILREISEELIVRLSDLALDVPFLLFNEKNEQADLLEIFDRICEYRVLFNQEQNPVLTAMLRGNDINMPLGVVRAI